MWKKLSIGKLSIGKLRWRSSYRCLIPKIKHVLVHLELYSYIYSTPTWLTTLKWPTLAWTQLIAWACRLQLQTQITITIIISSSIIMRTPACNRGDPITNKNWSGSTSLSSSYIHKYLHTRHMFVEFDPGFVDDHDSTPCGWHAPRNKHVSNGTWRPVHDITGLLVLWGHS